jgi:hypothetical protein
MNERENTTADEQVLAMLLFELVVQSEHLTTPLCLRPPPQLQTRPAKSVLRHLPRRPDNPPEPLFPCFLEKHAFISTDLWMQRFVQLFLAISLSRNWPIS